MGTTGSDGPTSEDLEDILNPETTLHEQTAYSSTASLRCGSSSLGLGKSGAIGAPC